MREIRFLNQLVESVDQIAIEINFGLEKLIDSMRNAF